MTTQTCQAYKCSDTAAHGPWCCFHYQRFENSRGCGCQALPVATTPAPPAPLAPLDEVGKAIERIGSEDFAARFDGNTIGVFGSYHQAEAELDSYVLDLIEQGLVDRPLTLLDAPTTYSERVTEALVERFMAVAV